MNRRIIPLVIVLISMMALRVSPGAFTATGIPVGAEKDFGMDLKVYNTSAEEAKYLLRVLPPEDVRQSSVAGYEPLPDPSWLYFKEGDTVTVPAGGSVGHGIMTRFPDKSDLRNRHFVAQVSVQPLSSGMFNTIIMPTYFLETESSTEAAPSGLCFVPSVVDADSTLPVIFNNANESVEVTLTFKIPDPSHKGLNYDNTRGYWWIKEGEVSLKGKDKFTLDAGESLEIPLDFDRELTGEILLFANGNTFCRILFPPDPPETPSK